MSVLSILQSMASQLKACEELAESRASDCCSKEDVRRENGRAEGYRIQAEALNAAIDDIERLDFAEDHLNSLSHDRMTCSVDMCGNCVTAGFDRYYEGPRRPTIRAVNIRAAIDAARREKA